jgi:hypothetical protein
MIPELSVLNVLKTQKPVKSKLSVWNILGVSANIASKYFTQFVMILITEILMKKISRSAAIIFFDGKN